MIHFGKQCGVALGDGTNTWTRILALVQAHSQVCKRGLFASLCLLIRVEQLCSYWTDLHEALGVLLKSVQKMNV